jgi:hypothetical protein
MWQALIRGESFGLGNKGVEVRSGHLMGEGIVYYHITSSSSQTIIDVRVGEKVECI